MRSVLCGTVLAWHRGRRLLGVRSRRELKLGQRRVSRLRSRNPRSGLGLARVPRLLGGPNIDGCRVGRMRGSRERVGKGCYDTATLACVGCDMGPECISCPRGTRRQWHGCGHLRVVSYRGLVRRRSDLPSLPQVRGGKVLLGNEAFCEPYLEKQCHVRVRPPRNDEASNARPGAASRARHHQFWRAQP